MTTPTETPRTDACPHCGAGKMDDWEEPIRFGCGTKEDEMPSYWCQSNRISQLKAEVERLRDKLRRSIEIAEKLDPYPNLRNPLTDELDQLKAMLCS